MPEQVQTPNTKNQTLEIRPNIWYLRPMPIYEFHCVECNCDSELLVRTTDWKGTVCPHCGSVKLEKKLSVFASSGGDAPEAPTCSGTPRSCGMCGTGRPHSH
ncbi:MAG TPA: zinc ribbon domain-containing protein [Verrucomicrobiae bacterium]|jgi:putative FmdB family regulatory protein